MSLKHILGIFIILSISSCSLSISCWHCSSEDTPDCADPFDAANFKISLLECTRRTSTTFAMLVNAFGPPPVCNKIVKEVNGTLQYHRGCYDSLKEMSSTERKSENFIDEYNLCSDRDGCNSSSMIAPIPLLLITVVTISNALLKIFV